MPGIWTGLMLTLSAGEPTQDLPLWFGLPHSGAASGYETCYREALGSSMNIPVVKAGAVSWCTN